MHDKISIHILKICGDSICRPRKITFKTFLRTGKFPLEWKKNNMVPTHKIGDEQTVKNNHPVSLLPICGKIFKRLSYLWPSGLRCCDRIRKFLVQT